MGTTKELRQLTLIHNLEQLLFVATPDDGDFLLSFFIDEGFCDGPDHAEEHWRIYNEHLPKGLWIIVLGYACG
jgi:hypothetical protein